MVLSVLSVATQDIDPLSVLLPLFEKVQPLLVKLSIVVGGIFGIYLILLAMRVYHERKQLKVLEDIRFNLDQLNRHYGIAYSYHQRGMWSRWIEHIQKRIELGKAEKHFRNARRK